MRRYRIISAALIAITTSLLSAAEPLTITGSIRATPDLPLADGVRNIEVFHAAKEGWTYNHHVDLAAWKGRLYLAWDSCEKDEDVGISRELYSISADGFAWSMPAELFPKGASTALRMYFYHARNGTMLALAGMRLSGDTTADVTHGGLIVREMKADQSLGKVFTIRDPGVRGNVKTPPSFKSAADPAFVAACDELLANKPFLEQQDYGRLLGDRRMKWHDSSTWPEDEPSRAYFPRFGKAMCFFHRKDGALVDVMKWGWVLVSQDGGQTWSSPTIPATLITGMAKVWGQRTRGGKYVLVYNPDRENRYPLVMVSGTDGITFGNMRLINGDHPRIRFPGLKKAPGPQYPRGISEWSTDGSWKDNAVWVAYSMNKEDIWISRISLP